MDREGSFAQMQGTVGSVIWLWVAIEREVRGLVDDEPKETSGPRSISVMLDAWLRRLRADGAEQSFRRALSERLRADLRVAQDIRNGICHGLCGLEAANSERQGRLIWRHHGIEESMTWDAFQEHFAWLSKVPMALAMLDKGDLSRHGRLIETPENRDWWRDEFGISLAA